MDQLSQNQIIDRLIDEMCKMAEKHKLQMFKMAERHELILSIKDSEIDELRENLKNRCIDLQKCYGTYKEPEEEEEEEEEAEAEEEEEE